MSKNDSILFRYYSNDLDRTFDFVIDFVADHQAIVIKHISCDCVWNKGQKIDLVGKEKTDVEAWFRNELNDPDVDIAIQLKTQIRKRISA